MPEMQEWTAVEATEEVKRKAIADLKGMRQIVDNEQLVRGNYIDNAVNKKLEAAGAICGGRKACLIGSLWMGSGIKAEFHPERGAILPFVYEGTRHFMFNTYPDMELAYDALNIEAEKFSGRIKDYTFEPGRYRSAAEDLFEHTFEPVMAAQAKEESKEERAQYWTDEDDIRTIINAAIDRIEAM